MKVAISLPDNLFDAADQMAKDLGVSRSSLIAAALEEYLAKHSQSEITERLNAFFSTNSNLGDPLIEYAQSRIFENETW